MLKEEEKIPLIIENNTLKVLNYGKDKWINWFLIENNKMPNFVKDTSFNGFNFSNLTKNSEYSYNVNLFLFYKKDKKLAINYTFKLLTNGVILEKLNETTYNYDEEYHHCEEI